MEGHGMMVKEHSGTNENVTIINHVAGKTTHAEVNSNRSWLATEETKVVIDFIAEVGLQGFGLWAQSPQTEGAC